MLNVNNYYFYHTFCIHFNFNNPLIMKTFISVLVALTGLCSGEYFPDLRGPQWKHASIADIRCPLYFGNKEVEGNQVGQYRAYKPDLSKELTHSGYFCHTGEWGITCKTGFFGGQDITHYIMPTTPDVSKCKEAIVEYNRGEPFNRGFPPENCGWMSTNTEHDTIVTISPHRVYYDPVLDNFLDTTFEMQESNV